MIDVTPFYNPFKTVEVFTGGKLVETIEKNGKVYKKIINEKARVKVDNE
jgi:hypothetical protein